MPTTDIRVDNGLKDADRHLRTFAKNFSDLTPFWAELASSLAETAMARWPLKRRSGKLRRSLRWAGSRLGRGGVYEPSPDRLTFGTNLFYARFAQTGTKRQRKTPLIHVDEDDARTRLVEWMTARAAASGLEVDR